MSSQLLVDTVSKYCQKYMKKLYENVENSYPPESQKRVQREYQKCLLSVADWSEYKKGKEFAKFLKWCQKSKKCTEQELSDNLNLCVINTISLILNKHSLNDTYTSSPVDLQQFVYKCLKRSSRMCYEDLEFKDLEPPAFEDIVNSLLYKQVPLKNVLEFIEKHNQNTKEYNFDKTDTEKSHVKEHDGNNNADADADGEDDGQGLRYMSSDEFYNEYYNSDDSGNQEKISKKSDDSLQQEVKHISVPRVKKPYYNYNK